MVQQRGAEPVRQTGWGTAITDLNNQIDSLRERLSLLADRLQPVLTPDTPGNPERKAERAPNPPRALILSEISGASERIAELRNATDEVISRLEV